MKKLKSSNLLVFEDTIPGVASAKRANATVIALGFDRLSYSKFQEADLEFTPDLVARDYDEATKMLGLDK
jgi:beta-phosphoglucomutase-like phosphatase (HAD superfamily)